MELHLLRTTIGIALIILSVASADQLFPESYEEFCTGEDCADITKASSDPAVGKAKSECDAYACIYA